MDRDVFVKIIAKVDNVCTLIFPFGIASLMLGRAVRYYLQVLLGKILWNNKEYAT